MPRRNDIAKILIIGSGLLRGMFCPAITALPQTDRPIRKIQVIVQCKPGLDQSERIFANPGLKTWKEYAKVADVPSLSRDDGEQMFALSLLSAGRKSVRLVTYNPDASFLQEYCYDQSGALRSLLYEVRTDWGWGYAEERLLGPTGSIIRRTYRFFETASDRTITRPRQADDVPDFLKPSIYSSFNSLPFIATLNKPRTDAAEK
jgi:hypothetical protein